MIVIKAEPTPNERSEFGGEVSPYIGEPQANKSRQGEVEMSINVKIVDLGNNNYKVIDIDTDERLILAGDASLSKLISKIIVEKGWNLEYRETEGGMRYSWFRFPGGAILLRLTLLLEIILLHYSSP